MLNNTMLNNPGWPTFMSKMPQTQCQSHRTDSFSGFLTFFSMKLKIFQLADQYPFIPQETAT